MKTDLNNLAIFLDIDDVICLNKPYGGMDLISHHARGSAFAEPPRASLATIYQTLFDPNCVYFLREIHAYAVSLGFDVRYVISSSWYRFLDCSVFEETFKATGLDFVRIHDWWCTPNKPTSGRAHNIGFWLEQYPTDAFLVLDDTFSGRYLTDTVTFCEEKAGCRLSSDSMGLDDLLADAATELRLFGSHACVLSEVNCGLTQEEFRRAKILLDSQARRVAAGKPFRPRDWWVDD